MSHWRSNEWPREWWIGSKCYVEKSAYDALKAENEQLKKVLAQEASDNDELGAEYILVNIQREEIQRLKTELVKISKMAEVALLEVQY